MEAWEGRGGEGGEGRRGAQLKIKQQNPLTIPLKLH